MFLMALLYVCQKVFLSYENNDLECKMPKLSLRKTKKTKPVVLLIKNLAVVNTDLVYKASSYLKVYFSQIENISVIFFTVAEKKWY